MMQTRTEHDLLGAREVPADAYWGIHTLRAIENFPISGVTVGTHPDLIRSFALVKKACALANRDVDALPPQKADAIIWACDQLARQTEGFAGQFPIDVFQGGAGTSTNMNVNEVLANLALEHLGYDKGRYDIIHPNDDVNMSQSTNDTYPTALRLMLYTALDRLSSTQVANLQHAFEAKAVEFAHVPKLGRTQLQDAVPMTLGQEFSSFAVQMAEERRHTEWLATLLLEVNLGATAIGTGITTPAGDSQRVIARRREVTGLPVELAPNLFEATSDGGDYVSAHVACKRIAVKVSKICNDLRLLSSGPRAGLCEIRLPERAAGSSIMPAKVNPVIPEVVNQVAFKVCGNDVAVAQAAGAGQLQLNAFEPVIAQLIGESIQLLSGAMDTLRTNCVEGITANPEVTRGYVRSSISLVTYLVPRLGHAECDRIGRECARSGDNVRDVVLRLGLLTPEEVDALLPVV
jgi:aspartate ammonia-lyase